MPPNTSSEKCSVLVTIYKQQSIAGIKCLKEHFQIAEICIFSGGSRGGSGGSNESPFEPKLFNFHREFQEKMVKLHKSNPAQLI